MFRTNLLVESETRKVIPYNDKYSIVEYERDMSTDKSNAMSEYFAGQMNIRRRQLAVTLNNDDVVLQAGAMQWISGKIDAKTDVKGVGDFAKKLVGASVTGETAVKPRYVGTGMVVLEPTYNHILIEDLDKWGNNGMVIKDGFFLACDGSVNTKVVARRNVSSAVLGGEGLFNLCLYGQGVAILESPYPAVELVTIELQDDTVKIDGAFAVAWSSSLEFTVEKVTHTLVGSAASGEGFVNVYRGSGKIIMMPV